jgi:hypothetical protein
VAPGQPTLFLVTGPPRSGTTFLSDWITECPDAYCVHEVVEHLADRADHEILDYLRACASTGADRLGKPAQREFLRWDSPRTVGAPRVLGLKEPLVWPADAVPYAVGEFMIKHRARIVVTIRHPYDLVASGRHRAAHTTNWPGFSVAEHCRFWSESLRLHARYEARGCPAILLRWEELVLEFDRTRSLVDALLGIQLPVFYGNEQDPEYVLALRQKVSLERGVTVESKRGLLTDDDVASIRRLLGRECQALGYEL